ncbi:MAG: hypothetical protein E7I47_12635 [Clostridium sp.]|nr:hypothetical protein [Clostridium sp.]MDU4320145.1 hypothetical protein [Clostridium sp.]
MCELMDDICCITCRLSMSEESKSIDEDDKLYCTVNEMYVAEDEYCSKYE